jgi:hypothetical protein
VAKCERIIGISVLLKGYSNKRRETLGYRYMGFVTDVLVISLTEDGFFKWHETLYP